mmetsp:Transcript_22920/g.52508  ORF Transcript_22920/g.52508 Transcript_22920/m.52508 type:complete len:133 (+) Transcript_22920:1047-1445(+)
MVESRNMFSARNQNRKLFEYMERTKRKNQEILQPSSSTPQNSYESRHNHLGPFPPSQTYIGDLYAAQTISYPSNNRKSPRTKEKHKITMGHCFYNTKSAIDTISIDKDDLNSWGSNIDDLEVGRYNGFATCT